MTAPRAAAIGLVAVVLAASLSAAPAQAQAYIAGPWFEYNATAGLLVVDALFYRVELNLTYGGTLTSIKIKYGGEEVEAAEAAKYLPSMLLYAYSNLSDVGPGSAVIEVPYKNTTYTTSYPGFLATRPWTAEILYNDTEVLVVALRPAEEASVDLRPVEVTVYLKFYRYLPLIEYRYVFSNPSQEPVAVYSIEVNGTRYGPIIELVAGDESPPTWNQTIMYSMLEGGLGLVNVKAPQYDFPVAGVESVQAVAVFKEDGEGPRFFVAVVPDSQPGLIQLLRGYIGEVKDPIRARLVYGLLELPPGGEAEIRLKLALAWADPGSLAVAGLAGLASKLLGPDRLSEAFNHDEVVSELRRELEGLQRDLNQTRAQLDDALKRLDEAEARAGELEGLLGLCQANLNATKASLASYRAAAERTALVGLISLAVGVVLGVAGYRYAGLEELLAAARREIKRTRR